MSYKLVIFDFDCTLANSFPLLISVLNQCAEKFNFNKVQDGQIETIRGYDTRELIKSLGIPFWKVPIVGKHMKGLISRQIDQVTLFDGVDTLLQHLACNGVKLAIVSSNSQENVCKVLGARNTDSINYFECGATVFGKSARLKKILKCSGVVNDDAISIGDEIRDIKAAKETKIASGAVSWGYNSLDVLQVEHPTKNFNSFEEMLNFI